MLHLKFRCKYLKIKRNERKLGILNEKISEPKRMNLMIRANVIKITKNNSKFAYEYYILLLLFNIITNQNFNALADWSSGTYFLTFNYFSSNIQFKCNEYTQRAAVAYFIVISTVITVLGKFDFFDAVYKYQ